MTLANHRSAVRRFARLTGGCAALGIAAVLLSEAIPQCPPPPYPTAGSPSACWNGDVNGDNLLNIADVVYLANWLFVAGSAPPAAMAQGLPADWTHITATLSADQSIPTSWPPPLPENHVIHFDVVAGNSAGEFNPTTGTFTAATNGTYAVTLQALWLPAGSPGYNAFLFVGDESMAHVICHDSYAIPVTCLVTKILSLNAGQELTARVAHGGPSQAMLLSPSQQTFLQIVRIR